MSNRRHERDEMKIRGTLCDLSPKEIEENIQGLAKLASNAKHICRQCARVSTKKKHLCKPTRLGSR